MARLMLLLLGAVLMVTEAKIVHTIQKRELLAGGGLVLLGCIVTEAKTVQAVEKGE